jgi:hypothetical protein
MAKTAAMQKLTKDELRRAGNIFSAVFSVVSADIDTLEGFKVTNKNCMALCVDYVYMYGPQKDKDSAFMSELYKRLGYDNVMAQLTRAYKLV